LAVYTTSVWPMLLDQLTTCPPVRTLLVAVLVWLCETLFSVWTVAYNFVPGGIYTREHTGWLIAAVMLMIGLATVTGRVAFNCFRRFGYFFYFRPLCGLGSHTLGMEDKLKWAASG